MSNNVSDLNDYDGLLPPTVALGLSSALFPAAAILTISSITLCCFACCRDGCQRTNDLRTCGLGTGVGKLRPLPGCDGVRARHIWFILSAAFLLLVSAVSLLYVMEYKRYEELDYKGPMRVTDWTYREYTDEDEHGNWSHFVEANVRLDWGYVWACPNHERKSCEGSRVGECSTFVCLSASGDPMVGCSYNEEQDARQQVEACVNELFEWTRPCSAYDPTIPPVPGEEYCSTLDAYGNCNDCSVRSSAPSPRFLRNFRLAVAVGTSVALTAVVVSSVWFLKNANRENFQAKQTQPPHGPYADSPADGTARWEYSA
uniref:Uncharacterized protein n=1 Tax=Amphora coffeiformis TaxID=265554 RepID=A0A7S3L5T6_9STRA|mmetsp:Transcript_1444/g.2956  ORF Transcript_1444/g.2956 Transcript_1444/m.2956 type:complete len:315 (+) Transcript_1444:103-1047(+)